MKGGEVLYKLRDLPAAQRLASTGLQNMKEKTEKIAGV
jgi:hypothetical protein